MRPPSVGPIAETSTMHIYSHIILIKAFSKFRYIVIGNTTKRKKRKRKTQIRRPRYFLFTFSFTTYMGVSLPVDAPSGPPVTPRTTAQPAVCCTYTTNQDHMIIITHIIHNKAKMPYRLKLQRLHSVCFPDMKAQTRLIETCLLC